MTDEARLDAVVITLDGRALTAEMHRRLTHVRVEESVHLPDLFELRFDDPHFQVFDEGTVRMGSQIEIAFRADSELITVTKGEATALSVEPGPTGRHELVVTGLDATHRLHREPHRRTYNQVTDGDVAAEIAAAYGLEADIDATDEVHEHLSQTNATDFTFLSARARRIGYDLWITGGTLHFKRQATAKLSPPKLRWGTNLRRFRVRFSSTDRCDEMVVRGWDPVGKQAVVGRARQGDAGSTAPGVATLADEAGAAFGPVTRGAGQFPVTTQQEADQLAGALLSRSSTGQIVLRAEALGDPLIAAGSEVDLEGVGERLAGSYLVTSVEHRYGAGTDYVSRIVCGSKQPSGLTDLLGPGHSTGRDDRGRGSLAFGVVTNVDDPLRLARVKVKLVDLETESTWAAVVAPGAGDGRGFHHLPEVGDSVLVGFEHDDHDRPLVLGGVYSREDGPPDPDAVSGGSVITRTWMSRAGHRIVFTDDGDSGVTVSIGDGDATLHLTSSATKLTGNQVEVTASSGLKLSGANVEIAAQGELKLSGATIRLN